MKSRIHSVNALEILDSRGFPTVLAKPRTRSLPTLPWLRAAARSRPARCVAPRIAKYNRLLEIEAELGKAARFGS